MLQPIATQRFHAIDAPVKLKCLSYNLTLRPRKPLANQRGSFLWSEVSVPLLTVPLTGYEYMFASKLKSRHTTKNFSRSANYKKKY